MKVLPQKNYKKPNYPGLKDVCKTTAVLALTTSTLVNISACKGPDVVGDVTAPMPESSELYYDGDMVEPPPGYQFNSNGDEIDIDYLTTLVDSIDGERFEINLADGSTLVIMSQDCTVAIARNISCADIEEDSEVDRLYSIERFERYDSVEGDVYFVPVDCDHFIDCAEIELAGDVVDTVEPGTFSFADVSSDKSVTVETFETSDENCYDLATGDRLCIMPDTYYVAYDVTLEEIDDDSQFYEFFSKEDYCFYETSDRSIVIVSKTSSSYYVDGFELDGDVVAIIEEE